MYSRRPGDTLMKDVNVQVGTQSMLDNEYTQTKLHDDPSRSKKNCYITNIYVLSYKMVWIT